MCLTLGFAIGIAAAGILGWATLGAAGALAGAAVVAWARLRQPAWGGLFALALAAAAGGCVLLLAGARGPNHVSSLPEGGQTLIGTVAGGPRYSDGWWRFVLEAESHEHGTSSEPTRGRVYVRLKTRREVQRGERWRLTGKLREVLEARNPGGRSEAGRLRSLGVSGVLTVGHQDLAEPLGQGRMDPVSVHAYAAQRKALKLLERHISGPYRGLSAAVAASVVFGVHAAPPPPEIADLFRRAGTIHLLVVSGAMVSMLFGLVFLPGVLGAGWRRLKVERQSGWPVSGRGRIALRPGPAAAVVAMTVVTYYAVLTEGGQAVARAAIMGIFVGLALVLRRVPVVAREHGLNVDHYTLLAAAALGILTIRPVSLFQPGFQLSFAAVWAILYIVPKAAPFVAWLPRWLGWPALATVAAQLATFPILAWHYGQAPIAGFGANLLAVPLAAVVLVAGMATCLLGAFLPWAASVAGWITGAAARAMVWVSSAFASPSWASLDVPRPGFAAIIAWYGAFLGLGWALARAGARLDTQSRG